MVRKEDLALSDIINLPFVDLYMVENKYQVSQVYQFHQKRVEGKPLITMSPEQALLVQRKRGKRRFESLLENGLIRELTSAEIECLHAKSYPGLHGE